MIGTTLGHYQVTEKLGEGGMGVVYKAQDLHLDRPVAIKVLPPEKVADPDRRQRFTQEAKAASALNHPNIVHVYDITSEAGVDFIAMEYVAGKTLDQVIPRKGMRLNEALRVAVQVADALAAAHAIGIVHRDIKPSNVMVSDQGRVKVLDFGLAKLTGRDESFASQMTTGAAVQTDAGQILGTVSYMSPEQAQGQPVDARSDIFSFGSLLYEMASGQRPFQGESSVGTLAAILDKEPPPLAGEIPAELERVLARCLRKDPGKRFQHMDDVRVALEELKEESDSGKLGTAVAPRARRRLPWVLAAAALAVVVLAAAGLWVWRTSAGRALPEPRLSRVTSTLGRKSLPALSPDGTEVAFSWNGEQGNNYDIYVQAASGTGKALPLTTDPAQDDAPCWSPDGRRLAFWRRGAGSKTGSIYTFTKPGGPEQKLVELPNLDGGCSWSPDDRWLAVWKGRPAGTADDGAGIYLLPLKGGEEVRVTAPRAPAYDGLPRFSRDGRSLAFIRDWVPGLSSDLFIQALSPEGLPQGEPRQITKTRMEIHGVDWARDDRSIMMSATPALMLTRLYRVVTDGRGEPERLELAGLGSSQLTTAPNSNRLVFVRDEGGSLGIWRARPGRALEPLITSALGNWQPQYSLDGRRVAFNSNRTETAVEIWVADADGQNARQLTDGPGRSQGSAAWSPDGAWIAFDSQDATGQFDIYVIASSGGKARRLTSDPSNEYVPSWSHDGQSIYFRTDRTGRYEIWRMPSAGGMEQPVTTEGGTWACESTEGGTLFFTRQGRGLFAKPIDGGPEQALVGDVSTGGPFAVVPGGVCYLALRKSPADPVRVLFYNVSSHETSEIAQFPLARSFAGLTVTPDRQSVLVVGSPVRVGQDLMLIEHFR